MVGYVIPEEARSLLHMVVISCHCFSIRQEDFMVGKVKVERDPK